MGADFGTMPPNDVNAEQCVLGAMLQSKDAIADVVEALRVEDFYLPKHQVVFARIVEMFGRGEPADLITVAAALAEAGDLDRAGRGEYLLTCHQAVPSAANGSYYARIVADRAAARRLTEAGLKITQMGYSAVGSGHDMDAVVDRAQQVMYDVGDRRHRGDGFLIMNGLFQSTLDEIEAAGTAAGGLRGIATGFVDLDRLLNGLQPGQLVIVAGRPGMGKSTLALDVVRHTAIRTGCPAAFFSLEMSNVEVMMRILSAEARVPLNVLRSGQLSDDDWTKLARRMGEIHEAPLFVDDTPNMTLMEIRAKARRLKQRHDLKLLVVDYLGLIETMRRAENRTQDVAELSRGLKLLAKELGLPVIAAHQLNRGPEQRQDKRPQLADLRDSGSVEQDADIVIFVNRDDYYNKESPRAGEADLIVAKHRNGATDTVTVAAQLHLSRFVDMAI
jgi:replicative DNA helicase